MAPAPEVWVLDCRDVDTECLALWRSVLDESECAKADARLRPEDKISYIAAHALTRIVLGQKIDRAPERLRFAMTEEGNKPFLIADKPYPFSISHTDGLVAVAIGDCDLGVDVEAVNVEKWTNEFIAFTFHPEEIQLLTSCPPTERAKIATKIWTAKEAFVKTNGAGLSLPFSSFYVKLSPEEIFTVKGGRTTKGQGTLWIEEIQGTFIVSLYVNIEIPCPPTLHLLKSYDL